MSKDFKVKNGLQVTTNITASGNISASGDITTTGDLRVDASASIGPAFFNSTYGTDGTLQVKSTTSDSGVPSAIYLEEVSGGEGWRMGIDAAGDLNFYNSEGTTEVVSFQDTNKVHVVGDISTSTDIYAGDDIFVGDDLFIGHKNALGISETSPSINFYSGSGGGGASHQLIRYSTDTNTFTIGRNHQTFTNNKLQFTVHNENTLSSMTIKSGSDGSLVGINNHSPTEALDVLGNIKVSGSSASDFIHLNNTGNITASGDISSSGKIIGTRLRLPNGQFLGSANNDLLFSTGIQVSTHITASGNIKSGGNLELTASSAGHITATGTGSFGAVTSTGTISSSGNLHLENQKFIYLATNDTADNRIRYHDGQDLISIKTQDIFLDTANGVGIKTFTPSNTLEVAGNISSSGAIHTLSHITASGNITSDGNVNAGGFLKFGASGLRIQENPTNTIDIGGGNFINLGSHTEVTGNITASQNISSSGTITMLTASIGGGIFTSASLAAGGGGGGGTTTNALTAGAGLNNGGGTFNGGTARTFSVDSASFAPFYSASMNDFTTTGTGSFGAVTSTGTISSSKRIYGEALYLEGNRIRIDNNAFEFTLGLDANNITSSGNISGSATSTGSFGRVEASTVGLTSLEGDGGNILLKDGASTRADIDISSAQVVISSSTSTMTLHGTNIILDGKNDITLNAPDKDITFKSGSTNVFHFNLEDSPELEVSPANMGESFIIDVQGDIALEAVGKDISLGSGTGTQEFIFNCEDAPELDVDGDFTIDGSGLIKLDSATDNIDLIGNVTASNNISASGTLTINDITQLNVKKSELTGSYGTMHGTFNINYGNGTTFSASLASAGDGYGEIMSHLPINGPSAGDIVFHTGGDWRFADADGTSLGSKMLGVALADGGGASIPGPVLIRGVVRLGAGHIHDTSGQNGDPLYLSTTAGHVQFGVPSGSDDVARIVGYCIDETNDIIYFNPSNTFVEVS